MVKKLTGYISKLWLRSASLFDPVQYFFNGEFWEEFLKRFGQEAKGKIVDLACGTGVLRSRVSPKSYLGVDINPDFIAHAKRTARDHKTRFLVGDITRYKISNDPDTVFFISAAHHLADGQLSQLTKLLKNTNIRTFILVDGRPRGIFSPVLKFLDVKFGGGECFRSPEEIVALVKPNLTVIKSGEFTARFSFYSYPYLIATATKP